LEELAFLAPDHLGAHRCSHTKNRRALHLGRHGLRRLEPAHDLVQIRQLLRVGEIGIVPGLPERELPIALAAQAGADKAPVKLAVCEAPELIGGDPDREGLGLQLVDREGLGRLVAGF
jgi:hypothetical protein